MRVRACSATVRCLRRPKTSQLAPKIHPKSLQNGITWPPTSVQNGIWAILRPQTSPTIVFMTASLVRDAASGLQIPPNSHPKSFQNRSWKHSASATKNKQRFRRLLGRLRHPFWSFLLKSSRAKVISKTDKSTEVSILQNTCFYGQNAFPRFESHNINVENLYYSYTKRSQNNQIWTSTGPKI